MANMHENFRKYNITPKKIAFFQTRILEWYEQNGRSFPWRKKGLSHYQYIIAEVLLQRTKAETIGKFYPQFIDKFPNWKSLANADIKTIEVFLKPVGLYRQRSQRLKNLANEMVKRNGRLPKDRKELEVIPFMGQYIANAVELVIFNKPSPLVDVNMARVSERYFGSRRKADIRYDSYLQDLAYEIVNCQSPKEINWGILDFASIICKSNNPKCKICILAKYCKTYFIKYGNIN